MDAKLRLRQIRKLLGDRELIYVGPRGADALPLASLGPFTAFSITAPAGDIASESCLETISGARVDLNAYSLDADNSEAAEVFRELMFAKLLSPCAIVPYSPSQTLSTGFLMALDTALTLGLHYEQQLSFDHKPWMEVELGRFGIPTVPWTYVRTLSSSKITDPLARGEPIVIREPRSRGGAGIWLIRNRGELEKISKSTLGKGLFCVAPYFESAISVNVNACVFADGEVSIHGTSLQLVGISSCTPRLLGYCGNDFASVSDLPMKALLDLDKMARSLGYWLARHGYLGAFGFDALFVEDRILFVEINPRFQASSAVASQIDGHLDRPDQYINHIAAFLGLASEEKLLLPDLVQQQPAMSYIMVYNGWSNPVALKEKFEVQGMGIRLLPASGVAIEPLGVLASILWPGPATATGHKLEEGAGVAVRNLLNLFAPVGDKPVSMRR